MIQGIIRSLCIAGVLVFTALFSAGCSDNQKAVNLYVDAVMLNDMAETNQAVAKLNEATSANPKFSIAYSLLGQIYQQMNDNSKSANAYEKAIAINKWSYRDYLNLGKVYLAMQKFNSAVKAYVRATEIKPDAAPAHLGAAESYYELKDYKNALKYGKRASQLDPNQAQIMQVLGTIYDAQKDYEQAIASYKRAIELNSNQPKVMNLLAQAYLRAGQFEPAYELLGSVVAVEPTSAAYQHLGYAAMKLKKFDEAIANYRKSAELAPNDAAAYKGLGVAIMVAATQNNDETLKIEAIAQWQKSLELESDQPKLRALLRKYQP
ncbi:MAG: tetratricopeptide repeat protein [Sedimentisphaerales bacterium]|nr:tetratricopeptide repeat protein [Sedimentisphaerales bacterium]